MPSQYIAPSPTCLQMAYTFPEVVELRRALLDRAPTGTRAVEAHPDSRKFVHMVR